MEVIRREFSGKADLQAMAALARACPADHLHVVDLAYRFSSWAFDDPDNIALWVNPEGQLLAWAVMQTPFWTIDYACRPDADKSLHQQFLGWADSRARTASQPEYIADLDLVAVAPDGRLAAFCIGWLDRHTEPACGQIEPLGVRADWRHLGLGRAILSEVLSRLQRYGASQIYVETDKQRNAALELYESVGFRIIQDVLVYRKDYESI